MTQNTSSIPATIAVVTARVIVPIWLTVGALLKLASGSPSHLPSVLITFLGGLDIDLFFVMQYSVAVELVVAGIMVLLPRLARPVGLVMLGAFFPILVGELLTGASSCGCFGAVTVHPAITVTMDGSFFLILLLLGNKAESLRMGPTLPLGRTLIVGVWILAVFALAFGYQAETPSTTEEGNEAGHAIVELPEYYLPAYDEWLGRNWSDVPIAEFIEPYPDGFDQGMWYILFYRKDCEHCHELMEVFFAGPLATPTLAVAVPEKGGFPEAGVLDFPCAECSLSQLPAGCDWFLTTPVLVRLNHGIVECAAEVTAGNPECYQW